MTRRWTEEAMHGSAPVSADPDIGEATQGDVICRRLVSAHMNPGGLSLPLTVRGGLA